MPQIDALRLGLRRWLPKATISSYSMVVTAIVDSSIRHRGMDHRAEERQ
jgi:hypothetical protein